MKTPRFFIQADLKRYFGEFLACLSCYQSKFLGARELLKDLIIIEKGYCEFHSTFLKGLFSLKEKLNDRYITFFLKEMYWLVQFELWNAIT